MPTSPDEVRPSSNVYLSDNSLRSAAVVVPLVLALVPARSVVDFGCKHGEWLSVFRHHGVGRTLGFDQQKRADWLAIDRADFRVADLNGPMDLSERADLAVCIEVAEHLREASAEPLVHTLTTVAPVVLFSAALPGQGGHGHLNEQPREYWHRLFKQDGFAPIDCLRPRIWQDTRVAFWYRQNLFLYASAEGLSKHSALSAEASQDRAADLELVHVSVLHRRSLAQRLAARLTSRRR